MIDFILLYYITLKKFNRSERALIKTIIVTIICTLIIKLEILFPKNLSFHLQSFLSIFEILLIIPIMILIKVIYSFSFDELIKFTIYIMISSFLIKSIFHLFINMIL